MIDKKPIITKQEYLVMLHDKEVREKEQNRILALIDKRIKNLKKRKKEYTDWHLHGELVSMESNQHFCIERIAELQALKKQIGEK